MSSLAAGPNANDELKLYRGSVAVALELGCVCRILEFASTLSSVIRPAASCTFWNNGIDWPAPERYRASTIAYFVTATSPSPPRRVLPAAPFRVLDAPCLRDDYYCSILAYSATSQTLAVGLGNVLYTWSEGLGARKVDGTKLDSVWLTSVAFSSTSGSKGILAAGRSDGSLILISTMDKSRRFKVEQANPVTSISWRPCGVPRPSCNPCYTGSTVLTEDLVVGDETGALYYYVVEWPMSEEASRITWPGSMTLAAKISLHNQQVCGLAWSPGGQSFATGGNDNLCFLLDIRDILGSVGLADSSKCFKRLQERGVNLKKIGHESDLATRHRDKTVNTSTSRLGLQAKTDPARGIVGHMRNLGPGCETQAWVHRAAVKAIAFCPWREGLVATGGGSNDKRIHFFHKSSGSALATISVAAQITSLVWSTTRREIAATFGYTQPEHSFRVAVFNWPDCNQVTAIPYAGDVRVLFAIPYPREGDARSRSRVHLGSDGCIVVASSDKTVKFHELWPSGEVANMTKSGMLARSDILNELDGITKDGDEIR
ncbi:hypothetical protein CP532_4809 [Ophiocordyceps camponoti-leonardi (nom. inval.)]|nr:hypothetical protein CP532_4809 [Ophiocordyceps camponoti-leonardi (nom. inval.)]